MTIKHLRIFITVCECGSITKAAKRLYLAQPSVSLAIKNLETHYNQQLFERIGHKLFLTPIGKTLLDYAQNAIALVDEMEDITSSKSKPKDLIIGSSVTIGIHLIPKIVMHFQKQNPLISVKVKVFNSQEIENKILANEIDLGLIEGTIHSDRIVSTPFLDDELEVICSSMHPFATRSSLTIDEIKSEAFALREQGSASREMFDYAISACGIKVNPVWECISTQAIIHAVKENLCISILPKKMIQNDLKNNSIVSIKISNLELKRKYHVIYHKNKYVSDVMDRFIIATNEIASFVNV